MPMTQPIDRIQYTETEVDRYKDDVETWKEDHDALARDCWVWEDLIGKANHLFSRILDLDIQVQDYLFKNCNDVKPDFHEKPRELLRLWLAVSLKVVPRGERLQKDYNSKTDGLGELKEHIEEAKSILTPDDEFFDTDRLSQLRDEAIADHRSGLTEPLLENERIH
jgi:hypothetical protein